jgi:hydrogenase maturation protease
MRKILVAGVGNVFLGDDGFGVEVAKQLLGEKFPEGVSVADFGIRGVHLAYQLLEGYDTLILIDAARRGDPPGTVFVLEPDLSDEDVNQRGDNGFLLDAHSMDPELVLGMLDSLGGKVGRVFIVGCEPESIEERMGLSEAVAAAIPNAVAMITELIERDLTRSSERGAAAEAATKEA